MNFYSLNKFLIRKTDHNNHFIKVNNYLYLLYIKKWEVLKIKLNVYNCQLLNMLNIKKIKNSLANQIFN